jgi:hypothetical protein
LLELRLVFAGKKKRRLKALRPFALSNQKAPRDMSRKEAIAQFDELMRDLPLLIEYFQEELRADGVETEGDPAKVLTDAGEWLVERGQLVWERGSGPLRPLIESDLSLYTMSACCYLGLLFGQKLAEHVPDVKWVLVTEDKRDMDYHWAVLRSGVCKGQLEPTAVALNFARSALEKSERARPLGELYKIWADVFVGKPI